MAKKRKSRAGTKKGFCLNFLKFNFLIKKIKNEIKIINSKIVKGIPSISERIRNAGREAQIRYTAQGRRFQEMKAKRRQKIRIKTLNIFFQIRQDFFPGGAQKQEEDGEIHQEAEHSNDYNILLVGKGNGPGHNQGSN